MDKRVFTAANLLKKSWEGKKWRKKLEMNSSPSLSFFGYVGFHLEGQNSQGNSKLP